MEIDATSELGNEDVASWVGLYGSELYAYAYRRIRSVENAEDVVQETFFAALKNVSSFRGESTPRTWLYTILRSKIIDFVRKAQRIEVSEHSSDDLDNLLFDDKGHWRSLAAPTSWQSPNTADPTESGFQDYINSCLAKLKPIPRTLLIMTYLDEVPAEEIRKEHEISASNYWVLLHRARHAMRLCIERQLAKEKESPL
ncbi:MAG: RNA polymerase sigma factor [Candidatus Kapabacteria bacterium]|nr:RNA polymerase sigma factor [Candidatus Kapabacteria bacterium]